MSILNLKTTIILLILIPSYNYSKDVDIYEGHWRIITIKPSFTIMLNNLGDVGPGVGPSLEFGIMQNDNFFGLCSSFMFKTSNAGRLMFFGGGFTWHSKNIAKSENIGFSPGLVLGYWCKDISIYSDGEDVYITKYLFGGPKISTRFGRRHFFITFDYSGLIGNTYVNLLDFGIEIDF